MPFAHPGLLQITQFIKNKFDRPIDLGIVLGSGLGALADQVTNPVILPYLEIPGFFKTRIPGHIGRMVLGELEGKTVALFSGRVHLYEGYSYAEVTLTAQIAWGLGAKGLLLSSAVGGLNKAYSSGDLMLIEDHINFQSGNPILEFVTGAKQNPFEDNYTPFVDMCGAYRIDMADELTALAAKNDFKLHRGILCAVPGPIYETPAEVRMLQKLGADAVCMSTVPEAIMCRYLGIDVVGLTMITNAAHAQSSKGPTHQEVLAASHKGAHAFIACMKKIVELF